MKKREKIALALLYNMKRNLTKIELSKLLFLLKQETSFISDDSFYDFVPYLYGPYSFSLFSDVGSLARQGYISETDTEVLIDNVVKVKRELSSIAFQENADVWKIIKKYSGLSQRALVDDIYARYPWFASRSKISKIKQPDIVAPVAIYTIGYEKKSIDTFLRQLISIGIKRIVDVRCNPISRVYGFSKKNLESFLSKMSVSYTHFPLLGIPSEYRQNLENAEDYRVLFRRYAEEVLPGNVPEIINVLELMKDSPSALLCFESNPACCHRGVLAKKISSMSKIPIKHL